MIAKWTGISIRWRLLLFTMLLLVVPLLVLGMFSYQTAKDELRREILKSAEVNVQTLNDTVSHMLQPYLREVEIIAKKLDKQPEQSVTALLEPTLLLTDMKYILVGDATDAYTMLPKRELPKDYKISSSDWYRLAMQDKQKVILTTPVLDTLTNEPIFTIAKATETGDRVVMMNVSLEHLTTVTSNIKIGQYGYPAILDAERKMIVHPSNKIGSVVEGDYLEAVYRNETGQLSYEFDGEAKEMVYAHNIDTGWRIIGSIYTNEFEEAAGPIFRVTGLIFLAALAVFLPIAFFMMRSITRPLNELVLAADYISQGDLTQRVHVRSHDELGRLGISFNRMSDSLRGIVSNVNETALHVASSSEELMASAEQTSKATEQVAEIVLELASGVDRQAAGVEQGARVVHAMTNDLHEVTRHAREVSLASDQTSVVAQVGNQAIRTAVTQMDSIQQTVNSLAVVVKGLGDRSQQIEQIVDVITGIADQTSLLALNAAIEAARVGEQGRGFAVVADEVRKLADQSAHASQEIAALIHDIQHETSLATGQMTASVEEVQNGMSIVRQAGESFHQIEESVLQASGQMQAVTAAVEQMTAHSEQVLQMIEEIAEVCRTSSSGAQQVSAAGQQQLASMEEITASATTLASVADELQKMVGQFKVREM